ncbi:MAG: excinuclease ABC subunit UvrC [Candidatus Neomarinimicrobiota bacterium]
MKEHLINKIKQAPTDPGVYQFFNSKNKIIYIGKAKNIKNRVRSYFQNSKNKSSKTITLVKNIEKIEWIIVRNEVEALMTEANLIKKHQPRYNIDLRDDKSYPFIRITNESYPQVFITRKIVRDGSKYYGPFTDSYQLRIILKAISRLFQIRSCSYSINEEVISKKKISVCLDYHIKKCEGPCEGLVSEHKYSKMIKRVEDFMRGKTKDLEHYLKMMMMESSKMQKYEEAATYRDQLNAINVFKKKQSQVATDFTERDVITVVKEGEIGVAVVLRIRNGKIFSRDKLHLKQLLDDDGSILKTVITRFYMDSDFIPQEISLQYPPKDEHDISKLLCKKRKKKVNFVYPKIGEKAKELRVTLQNAKLLLGEWKIDIQKRKDYVPKTLQQLKDDLNMEVPPKRIEGFDVSHLGGTNTVASMVCFVDGKPKRSEYRKFNIKSVDGIDDFASIREVVLRRYKRVKNEKLPIPDLILIDGGKGQLSMALSALRELGMDYIPVIGLAKKLEEIYVPGNSEPQNLKKSSSSLILLMRIRDEAHRFAISFQKSKRKKDLTKSIFSNINGVGKKRLEKLLQIFNGPKEISESSPEIIHSKTGIPIKIATEVIRISRKNSL